ncbi:DUF697 domain-containing protein [Roseivirga sp. BDSF3-8]|uniref:DUF697 domain-containing protein n=1 Tax=Roseivirga sp. BDSF3-8 TaxID=3241598 RepID=UPI0035324120
MKKTIFTFVRYLTLLFLVVFLIFVFNQLSQLYLIARDVGPVFAIVVVTAAALLILGLFLVPVYLYFTLPSALVPPDTEEEFDGYRMQLFQRLKRNKHLKEQGYQLTDITQLEEALSILDARAREIIDQTAKSVFVTTAISQNGKLDALTVFATQTKMVYQIARLYYQRPSLKDLLHLYGNVGAASLFAVSIEEMDITEQIEPVIRSMVKNTAGRSIPFVGSITHIITDSLMEGTVNAFLTLRVGVITSRFCGAVHTLTPAQARRSAFSEASGMLRKLVLSVSGSVINAIMTSAKRAGAQTFQSGVDAVSRVTTQAKSGLVRAVEVPMGWFSKTTKK